MRCRNWIRPGGDSQLLPLGMEALIDRKNIFVPDDPLRTCLFVDIAAIIDADPPQQTAGGGLRVGHTREREERLLHFLLAE